MRAQTNMPVLPLPPRQWIAKTWIKDNWVKSMWTMCFIPVQTFCSETLKNLPSGTMGWGTLENNRRGAFCSEAQKICRAEQLDGGLEYNRKGGQTHIVLVGIEVMRCRVAEAHKLVQGARIVVPRGNLANKSCVMPATSQPP